MKGPLDDMVQTPHGSAARSWSLVAVAAVVALTLAGCGAGEPAVSAPPPTATVTETAAPTPTPTEAAPAAEVTFEEASLAYETCLVTNGSSSDQIPVDQDLGALAEMADASPEVLAEMRVDETFVKAHATCWPAFAAALAAGATPSAEPVEPAVDPEKAAKMLVAVQCLNARGWDFLEPGVETGALTMEPRGPDFDWADATFLQDQMECQREAGMIG